VPSAACAWRCFLDQPEQEGTIYASRPIVVGRPVWRVDLLESVENPGSLDRAHHHPRMTGFEPGKRKFEPELTADPIGWVAKRLENVEELLQAAGIDSGEVDKEDVEELRAASPEILAAVRRLLERISVGEIGRAPENAEELTLIRSGWL